MGGIRWTWAGALAGDAQDGGSEQDVENAHDDFLPFFLDEV